MKKHTEPANYPLPSDYPSALATVSAYRFFMIDNAEQTLDTLAQWSQRSDSARHALEVLADCGKELSEQLIAKGSPSQSSKDAAHTIASQALYDSPQTLHAFSEAFPAYWSHFARTDLFDLIEDACENQGSEAEHARQSAAELSHHWVGSGLKSSLWERLAEFSYPTWSAFYQQHHQQAKEQPERLPGAKAYPSHIRWKAAARIKKHLGVSGYGCDGNWLNDCTRLQPSFSDRLSVAFGLDELLSEIQASQNPSKNYTDACARLGQACGHLLFSNQACGAWSNTLERVFAQIQSSNINPARIMAPMCRGFGLPESIHKLRQETLYSGQTMHSSPALALPELLLLSPNPQHQRLGFSWGADHQLAISTWREALSAQGFKPGLGDLLMSAIQGHPTSVPKTIAAHIDALVESHAMRLSLDAHTISLHGIDALNTSAPKPAAPRL